MSSTSSVSGVQSQYIRVLERLKDLVEENKRLKSRADSYEDESKLQVQKYVKTISGLEKELRDYENRIGDLNVSLHRKGKDALRTEWEVSRANARVAQQEEEICKLREESEISSERWISELNESQREAEERSEALIAETEEEISSHYEDIIKREIIDLEVTHERTYTRIREEFREKEDESGKRRRAMTSEMQDMEASIEQLNRELKRLRNVETQMTQDPVTKDDDDDDDDDDGLVDKLQRENARLDDELRHALNRIAELERRQEQQTAAPRESQSQQQKRRPRPYPHQTSSSSNNNNKKKVLPRLNRSSGKHRHWASSASPLTVRRSRKYSC